jgi:molybdopterin/thiamine biosynthesis adenylyltransferase
MRSHAMNNQPEKRVLIVGAGGLGVPAALALVRGGIRRLVVIDPDLIELSNLPRQVIYREADVGIPKVVAMARYLRTLATDVVIEPHQATLDAANATQLISRSTFVIDGTDNPSTKFLINDACIAVGAPFVYGGVIGMTGQTMTVLPGRSACLRCIFEESPDADEIASCRDAGIMGPVAGAIGEAQADEAIRWWSGVLPALAGRMLTYDGRIPRVRITEINARRGCPCGAAQAGEPADTSARTS